MTTTLDKIQVMQAFADGAQIQVCIDGEWKNWNRDGPSDQPTWNWDRLEYRVKTPKPKPIERWVNVYEAGQISDAAHPDEDLAKQWGSGNAKRVAVHMREVTPQDEQDRKDAARYRKYKDLLRRKTNGWWCSINFDTLDRLLDEAIEGGDAE